MKRLFILLAVAAAIAGVLARPAVAEDKARVIMARTSLLLH